MISTSGEPIVGSLWPHSHALAHSLRLAATSVPPLTRFMLHSFVDRNKSMRWCPGRNCNYIFKAPVGTLNVKCEGRSGACGIAFCFKCGEEAHQPSSCHELVSSNLFRPCLIRFSPTRLLLASAPLLPANLAGKVPKRFRNCQLDPCQHKGACVAAALPLFTTYGSQLFNSAVPNATPESRKIKAATT